MAVRRSVARSRTRGADSSLEVCVAWVGAENIPRAPRTLIETTRAFRDSKIARDWLGDDFVDHFAATREWEWRQWLDGVTDWELKRYFEIV